MSRRRVFRTKDGYDPKDLLRYAEDHLASAQVLFRAGFRCYDSAGSLSHLGLELILKCLLLRQTGEFPDEHDLTTLFRQLAHAGVKVALSTEQQSAIEKLNSFATIRYPDPQNPVQIGTGDWDIVFEMYKSLFAQLPDELKKRPAGDERVTKGGRVLMVKELTPDDHDGAQAARDS